MSTPHTRHFITLLLSLWGLCAQAQVIPRDVNHSGGVNVADLARMIDQLQSGMLFYSATYDANSDGLLNQNDVIYMRDYILQRYTQEHEAVDLGLSVLWATCNVGALQPSDYGSYFSWGETWPKSNYSEASYLYYNGSGYQSIGSSICGGRYDAATEHWGDGWHMPTQIDINQLMKQCTWTPDEMNGIKGYTVTGPNGNSIFLPMAGVKKSSSTTTDAGQRLYYWSGAGTGASAYCLNDAGYSGAWAASRASGMPIRPVKSKPAP